MSDSGRTNREACQYCGTMHEREATLCCRRRLQEQINAAQSTIRILTSERDAILSQARKDNLRAEQADQYEAWLLDLGRISGCGHVDERLPRCISEAFEESQSLLQAANTTNELLKAEITDARAANDTIAKQIARLTEEIEHRKYQLEAQLATAKSVWAQHEEQFAGQQERIVALTAERDKWKADLDAVILWKAYAGR